jgi:hypothetical protein
MEVFWIENISGGDDDYDDDENDWRNDEVVRAGWRMVEIFYNGNLKR